MAQSVERRLGKAEVTGSIPVISLVKGTRRIYWFLFNYVEKEIDYYGTGIYFFGTRI